MYKIRRDDIVEVSQGKDKGKKGKVLDIFTQKSKALVQGINLVKKHKRKTRDDQQGGVISIESPISLSNLMFFCKNCARGVRIGFKFLPDKTKVRFCKTCKEAV